ncbi:MAG TPA: hypothetical protein VMZ28_24265 [Kofleriaceae bacterium]|nr:hypothetical protein [Kofleriaceae bacterium]
MTIAPIELPALTASARLADDAIWVTLAGTADAHAQSALAAFLCDLHASATAGKIGAVEIDVRDLIFMSSSCMKPLVTWLASIDAAEDGEGRYSVCFLSNPRLHWQRRSLQALSCFAAELVSIQQ